MSDPLKPSDAQAVAAAKRAALARLLEQRGLKSGTRSAITVRPDPATACVSHAQRSLWFMDRLSPASSAYNVSGVFRLRGDLNLPALEGALAGVVRRHETLRSRFPEANGEPTVIFDPPGPLRVKVEDLTRLSGTEVRREAKRLAEVESQTPFDLGHGPLHRFILLRLSSQEHLLVVTLHHIVFDGASLAVFLRELGVGYAAVLAKRTPELPALAVQYADYAYWQQRELEGPGLERHVDFWRERLAGVPPVLELPLDRARPALRNLDGARVELELPSALSERVRGFCQREGMTLFTVFGASFFALLRRWVEHDAVVIGTPTAGRSRPELEPLIGFFANLLVLRVDCPEELEFRELVAKVRESFLASEAHEALPFEQLVRSLHPDRNPAHAPLVQVVFGLQDAVSRPVELPSLQVIGEANDNRTSKFDLSLFVKETGGGFLLSFEYATALFAEPTVRGFAAQFSQLLESALTDPKQRICDLALMNAEEHRRVLEGWNETRRPYPSGRSLAELFAAAAQHHPERTAVQYDGIALTYEQLERRSNRLAALLRSKGVTLGARVGLHVGGSVDMVVAMLAVLKAGAAYVPLDRNYPISRLRFMIGDAGIGVVLSVGGLELPDAGVDVLELAAALQQSEAFPDHAMASGAGGDSLAYIIYTSGSTGVPKGVAVPQRAVARLVLNTDYITIEPRDVIAQAANLSFDAATFEIWGALLNGARVVGIGREVVLATDAFVAELAQAGVTTLFLTTALFNHLARNAPGVFARLDNVLFGGEAVDPDAVRRVLAEDAPKRLLHVYGPTECTTFATWQRVTSVPPDAPTVPIGRPIANTTAYVVDRRFNLVPPGGVGELLLGGDGLAVGYCGRADLTAERFVTLPSLGGHRAYRTGDKVRRTMDGTIEFIDRMDHQVKIRGYRIELGEIEAALRACPGVKDSVTVATRDPQGRRLVGYVTPVEGATLDANDLLEDLRTRLPEYMVPWRVLVLESFPLNPNGKVDRGALPSPDSLAEGVRPVSVPPQGELEQKISRLWAEVLKREQVGRNENFFDLGGHSLLVVQVHSRLQQLLGRKLAVVELFQFPTVASLARHLEGAGAVPRRAKSPETAPVALLSEPIAIIGMAGRVPGAKDLEGFWEQLAKGVESVAFFTPEQLEAEGLDPAVVRHPQYVPAKGILEGAEWFDAGFFGYSAREAEIIDPQQRTFLECAWEALESSGCDPDRYGFRIGVFGGVSLNSYWGQLRANPEIVRSVGSLQTLLGGDKDFLTTRVSYKLNLHGPSLNVQTACSTSLVAVHLACQSLRLGECAVALAGGVSITLPLRAGYVHQEEGIGSPDGHCRPFDAEARGTVFSNGVGIVVLKRLSEAKRDGDVIHGIILGSAINNDGSGKVGYTAPSVDGQAEVIRMAQAQAGVDPATIQYVEAHGTGTGLGDPIEIAALTQAFGKVKPGNCLIGSLKSNVGHLDAAAGVAGLMKTVMCLERGQLVASLNYERPNPKIEFAGSPFEVNTELREWRRGEQPRRAGVSSFGIGGTNAHVVLEEAPEREASEAGRGLEVLVMSARNEAALAGMQERLCEHVKRHPEQALWDVAWTLQTGRKGFEERKARVVGSAAEAQEALSGGEGWVSGRLSEARPRVIFLFSGQGSQQVGMGQELYEQERVFREWVDRGSEILQGMVGEDLRGVMYPAQATEAAREKLNRTEWAQPALYVMEYALCQLWKSWGVEPEGMVGHSIGEYVAATEAGVMSFADGVRVVTERGRLMQGMESGRMLAVMLGREEVESLVGGSGVEVAAYNGPKQSVVSGSVEAIERLAGELKGRGVGCKELATTHAFHSRMVEPVLGRFLEVMKGVELREPQKKYVSNVSGKWVKGEEARSAEYWVRHLRRAVDFAGGVEELEQEKGNVYVEVGPGRTLVQLVKQGREGARGVASQRKGGRRELLESVGQLWCWGLEVDWTGVHEGRQRLKVPLPTYAFQRQRYWVERKAPTDAPAAPMEAAAKKPDIADWFYCPVWRQLPPLPYGTASVSGSTRSLVLVDEAGLGLTLAKRLEGLGQAVMVLRVGAQITRVGPAEAIVDPTHSGQIQEMLREFDREDKPLDRILCCWTLPAESGAGTANKRSFYRLVALLKAVSERRGAAPLRLEILTRGAFEIADGEDIDPSQALVSGALPVAAQEDPALAIRQIDVGSIGGGDRVLNEDWILREIAASDRVAAVALRGRRRWRLTYEAVSLGAPPATIGSGLRPRGVYLITGGLGGVGLILAERLATRYQARLCLVGRTAMPARADWSAWVQNHPDNDPTVRRIRRIEVMESAGAEVLVMAADCADRTGMRGVLGAIRQRFGTLNGVIHAAGVVRPIPLSRLDSASAEEQLRPKVEGVEVLREVLADEGIDFCLLTSSISTVLGGWGFGAYAAANAYLDAVARQAWAGRRGKWLSVGWDAWQAEGGEAPQGLGAALARLAITPTEGADAFERSLQAEDSPHWVLSTAALERRITEWTRRGSASSGPAESRGGDTVATGTHPRPQLRTNLVLPRSEMEREIAVIWESLLGVSPVGVEDDFFELGGNSLIAIQSLDRLRQSHGVKLPVNTLFDTPTVAGVAAAAERAAVAAGPSPEELENMLRMVEDLSPDQVSRLLGDKPPV